ncbi:MAG: hypothetical protein FWB72_05655 [Firmicutes bacterium]|nr:hypothetical protein [Bacillota bacterium]
MSIKVRDYNDIYIHNEIYKLEQAVEGFKSDIGNGFWNDDVSQKHFKATGVMADTTKIIKDALSPLHSLSEKMNVGALNAGVNNAKSAMSEANSARNEADSLMRASLPTSIGTM